MGSHKACTLYMYVNSWRNTYYWCTQDLQTYSWKHKRRRWKSTQIYKRRISPFKKQLLKRFFFHLHPCITTSRLTSLARTCCSSTTWIPSDTHCARLLGYSTSCARAPSIPVPRTINAATVCVAVPCFFQSNIAGTSAKSGYSDASRAILCTCATTSCAGGPWTPTSRRTITITAPTASTAPRIDRAKKKTCKKN